MTGGQKCNSTPDKSFQNMMVVIFEDLDIAVDLDGIAYFDLELTRQGTQNNCESSC